MRTFQRLTALWLAVFMMITVLAGCGEQEKAAGLSLSVCVGPAPVSLDPIYAEQQGDQSILAHLYENLMRVAADENGNAVVETGVAKSVEHEENHDGTMTYTFRLRNAKWSDGRDVTANDFVYAWQRLANPASQSPYAELLSVVVGYEEARASGEMDFLQVTAKNDTTLVVNLTGHYDWFLREVCTSPATMPLRQDVVYRMKEAAKMGVFNGAWWGDAKSLVTNGPYLVSDFEKTGLTLTAGDHYETKKVMPAEIRFCFADSAETAWEMYEAEEIDAVWSVGEERLAELAEEEDWMAIPELAAHSVLFNGNHPLLGDVLIRQAMTLAMDRNALAGLAGITARPAEGLIPHGVPENDEGDFRTNGGELLDNDPEAYQILCENAKLVLEEAGYSSGGEFGEMEFLYVESPTAAAVAQALCQQWQAVLGMQVVPRGVTESELWAALRSGEYALAGVELEAVGNDAECFLMEWTSDNPNNVIGYTNTAYDTLMSIIASAADGAARMGCLHDAEVLLLSDYALAPIYTHGVVWEMRPELVGACRDARGWFSFAGVMEKQI